MLKISTRNTLLALAFLPLGGCLHLQLTGSVSDANITIASIYERDTILFEGTSTGRDLSISLYGEQTWEEWGPLLQMWLLGIVTTGKTTPLEDNEIYLVTVMPGGFDEDAERPDGLVDVEGSLINGRFHAILTGAQIKGETGKVSVLTELLYQAMFIETGSIDGHDDNWFFTELDSFSERLVGDINGDKRTNYADILQWSILTNADEFIGDHQLLDQYRAAIIDGTANDAQLFDLAVQVLDSSIDTAHPLAGNYSFQVQPGSLICNDGSDSDLAAFSENLLVSIVDDAISFPSGEWSEIPDWEILSDSGISGSFNAADNSFIASQVLTGIPQINTDLGERSIEVNYSGSFAGNQWSGSYHYIFNIEEFDFTCESSQAFSGSQLD